MPACLAPVPFLSLQMCTPSPVCCHSNRLTLKLGEAWLSMRSWNDVGCILVPVWLDWDQLKEEARTQPLGCLYSWVCSQRIHRAIMDTGERERGVGCIHCLCFAWGLGHLKTLACFIRRVLEIWSVCLVPGAGVPGLISPRPHCGVRGHVKHVSSSSPGHSREMAEC